MRIYIVELQRTYVSRRWDGVMPAILGVWSEREGWQVRVHYTGLEGVDYDEDCDVVAISTYTHLARECFEVARRFRALGKLVVIGGPHTKGGGEESTRVADAVFDQCDETLWRGFLGEVAAGQFRASTPGRVMPSAELKTVPPYREYSRFMGKSKVPMVFSSLGCPYTCDFCTDWDRSFYKRSVEDVLADVADVEKSFFFFVDPNFGANPVATAELLERMVPLGKKYFMQCSFSFLTDERTLKLLRDSGCGGVQIGLESFSTSFKKNAVRRGSSILDDTIEKIRRIKRYIPFVQANIILGFDEDTEETFEAVREFHRSSNADILMPHIATPYPGTPLHDRMRAEGRIFDPEPSHYDSQNLVITLKQMPPERFYDLYIDLYRELRSLRSALAKARGQWRDSRSLWRSALLFAFLARKGFMTRRYEYPDLLRARARVIEEDAYAACLEGSPRELVG